MNNKKINLIIYKNEYKYIIMSGIIYLIQSLELVGTNRYKIGRSSKTNLSRLNKGYKKD